MRIRRKTKKVGKLFVLLFILLVVGGAGYYTYSKISEQNRIKNIKKVGMLKLNPTLLI